MHDSPWASEPDSVPIEPAFEPRPFEPPTSAPPKAPPLAGHDEPWTDLRVGALADALLRAPASVLAALRANPMVGARLALIVVLGLGACGLVMATFSGGLQLLFVPVKLILGMLVCALVCLPSLHVFSCLSGAQQTVRETWGAMLMGIALMGMLLVGFAPVLWIFGQATHSIALMGALHLCFFLISAGFGLGLSLRALSRMNDAPVRAGGLWAVMFVCVLLQMSTTLRPLVGPFDGVLFHERLFFVGHWFQTLGS